MCDHCATNAVQFPEAALSAGTTKASEKDTKFHFKWALKEMVKDMQNYYAGLRPLLQRIQVSLGI